MGSSLHKAYLWRKEVWTDLFAWLPNIFRPAMSLGLESLESLQAC